MKKVFIGSMAALVLLGGCAAGKSINGKWNVQTSAGALPEGSTVTAEFSGSDQMLMIMDIKQPIPGNKPITLHGEIKGTYKIDKGMMTMKASDVKFTGKDFPAELKSVLEGSLDKMGTDVKEKVNKEGVTKFAWVDDNSFTLTGASGKPETYTRAK